MAKGQQSTKNLPAKKVGLNKTISKPAKNFRAKRRYLKPERIVPGEILSCA